MESMQLKVDYGWEPFTLSGRHLTFEEHCDARLSKTECSHWGEVVYKWEGTLTSGEHTGKVGVLIGETGDLRQRIKQYVSGTQERGNRLWRETFLTKGKIYLFILRVANGSIENIGEVGSVSGGISARSPNVRRALEQLLVTRERTMRRREDVWIVNT